MPFVEELPVVVPALDDEASPNFSLLSGWDCRSSVAVVLPEVLGNFDKIPTVEQNFPVQTLDYELKHIKDTTTKRMTLSVGLGLEMKTFFGLVINVGKAQYKTEHQTELVKEHLQIYYYREDNVKRILLTEEARQTYSEIWDEGQNRSASATHVVTEVTLGAHFVADITIETSKSTKLNNRTASGLGSLVIGPISSAVEAGLSTLCKSPPDKVDIQINAESSHFPGSKKFESVDEVFAFIKNGIAEGKPVKYFCVPISQFFHEARLTLEVLTYRIIGNHLLQPLFQMIETLNDYKSGEYIRKRIMHADPRFKLILEDPYSQRVSWGKTSNPPYQLDDIPRVIEILSAAFGVNVGGGNSAFFWYSRLASQMAKPVALPLAKDNIVDVKSLIDHVWSNWNYVTLFENFIAVKDFLQGDEVQGKYVFCFPTNAPLGTPQGKEVIKMLRMRNNLGVSNVWIVADFDFLLSDAPFLIVFLDGKAIGQCYDYLDLLELEAAFGPEVTQIDLSNWVEFSNFRGRRAPYMNEVDIIFKVNQNAKERKELHIDEDILTRIENAVSLCSAFMQPEDRIISVLSAIFGMFIVQYPPILAPLEDAGWSLAESRFINDPPLTKELTDGLIHTFETLLLHLSPNLIQISALMNTVQSCVEDLESDADLHFTCHNIIVDMISAGSLGYVNEIDPEIGRTLKAKLKHKDDQTALERWTESVRIIREELLFKEKVRGEHEMVRILQDVLTLMGQLVFEEESDEYEDEDEKRVTEEDVTLEIVTRHVLLLPWTSGQRQEIEQHMRDKLIPKVFERLSHLQYREWWNEAHELFYGMESSTDYGTLGAILNQLDMKAWSDDQYASVWQNEVFASWVYDGLDNPTFLEGAKTVLIRDDGSIPKYIPVPIEKKLRSLLDPPEEEGENETAIPTDPLHPKEWSTIEDALSVLQIAVALPIEFPSVELMQLLRRNLRTKEEIYDGFRKAGTLFYWDTGNQWFKEPWDLKLARKAVLQIMKSVQDEEDLLVKPIPIGPIDQNLELIALVEFMTLQSAHVATCHLQKRRNFSNLQWNAVWKGNKEYKKIMTAFLSLTDKEVETTSTAIYGHLDELLLQLVEEECNHLIQRVKMLWKKMVTLDESKDEMRKQIREIRSLIGKRALLGKHFYREIFKIPEITRELEGGPLQSSLNKLVSEFGNGYSLEFVDRYRRHVNHVLMDIISQSNIGDLKVFVLGIAGDGGKNALKNGLLPPSGARHENSYPLSDHATLTLWRLPPHEMNNSSWYDAFLIIEIDDMFLTEVTPEHERIMTSVLLDVADLTVFYSYKIRDEILIEMESALCHSWSTSGQDKAMTDVILASSHGDLDLVKTSQRFTTFEKAVQDNRFLLGRRKDGSIAKILTRFEENRAIFPVAETISETFDPQDVQILYEEVIKTSKEIAASNCNKLQTLTSALTKLQTCWTSLIYPPTPLISHADVSSYLLYASETLIDFDRVRTSLEIASIQHALDCRKYLAERHPTVRSNYSDTLETIKGHILAAGNLNACKPIAHKEGSPCSFCLSAAREWTTFSAKHDKFSKDNYTKYVAMLTKVQFSRLYRLLKSVEIKQLRGITEEFEMVYKKLLPQWDRSLDTLKFAEMVVQEFKGVMGDGDAVVSPIRLVEFDVTQAYPQSPQLLEQFMKYGNDPSNKFPDLCALKNGVEIKAKLQNVAETIRSETSYEYGAEYNYFYEIGFARKCRDKVETIFFEYETRFLELISDEMRWSGHLYCLKTVLSKMNGLIRSESLVECVTRVEAILLKEIVRRLGNIIGPANRDNGLVGKHRQYIIS
ncbi:uncharacterized protein LOC118435252 [Folsomia candida]|uniref:uncharacterized protein LOC118435252 n=1 Tax=Folsomia candida TaxID=158441 RepID=UPI001604A202|nr:uncharacterized protein LOC118435252 [Folsomia candida]